MNEAAIATTKAVFPRLTTSLTHELIDTIRFITNGCSKTGFSKSAIDDVTISKGK